MYNLCEKVRTILLGDGNYNNKPTGRRDIYMLNFVKKNYYLLPFINIYAAMRFARFVKLTKLPWMFSESQAGLMHYTKREPLFCYILVKYITTEVK